MMKMLGFALVGSLFLSASAFAQTCASPLAVPPKAGGAYPIPHLTGTTCGGTPGLNLGGVIYAQPSVVYSFVANAAAAATGATITVSAAGSTNRELGLVTSCSTAPFAIGAEGFPMVIAPGALTAGTTYLLIVTSDSGLPPPPPVVCGPYSLSTVGTLPVSLQGFSVE